ncbi:MAG: hypothetical protein AAGD05_00550 [Bacteroidota bacterium]
MKSTLRFFPILLAMLCFSSCFEIKEEVNMNNDGSGTMVLTMDMSASKENLANFMEQGQMGAIKMPDRASIEAEMAKLKKAISETKGMSNVQSTSDYTSFIFTMSGDFKNTKSLNKAINNAISAFNDGPLLTPKKDNFAYSTNLFKRYFKYRIRKGMYEKMDFGTRFVLDASRVKSIYHFQKPVKQFTNSRAQLSPDKKTVEFSSSLAEIAKGSISIENDISF